mmetsp:Transcript_21409/g.42755  ORF Transcript_21409/g.42755 Transcript_21409/m.42755 type:complete len:301 (-) Transcript_21409:11-913(-)
MLSADPITDKETTTGKYSGRFGSLNYVHTGMQGWRESMEDSHVIATSDDDPLAVFGVFDGHGGDEVAKETAKVATAMVFDELRNGDMSQETAIKDGVTKAFVNIDDHLRRSLKTDSGCTANVVLISENLFTCANIGDSRSVLSRSGLALEMSKDHKPTDEVETDRIKKAGGSVIRGRVCGGVAVSRSFGDFHFKANSGLPPDKQQISCCPDFIVKERDHAIDEFLIVCCDGIWDVITNQACVRFVRTRLQAGISDVSKIAQDLLDYCLGNGSKDNMTCVIVLLPAGEKLIQKPASLCSIS